jgi:hypothetical protein
MRVPQVRCAPTGNSLHPSKLVAQVTVWDIGRVRDFCERALDMTQRQGTEHAILLSKRS